MELLEKVKQIIADDMESRTVTIEVWRGIAEVVRKPDGIIVEIIDHD